MVRQRPRSRHGSTGVETNDLHSNHAIHLFTLLHAESSILIICRSAPQLHVHRNLHQVPTINNVNHSWDGGTLIKKTWRDVQEEQLCGGSWCPVPGARAGGSTSVDDLPERTGGL